MAIIRNEDITIKNRPFEANKVAYPIQRITEKQKEKEYGSIENWAKLSIDWMTQSSTFRSSHQSLRTLFNLAGGVIDEGVYDNVVHPWGDKYEFPNQLVHHDIVSPILKELTGEELRRPFAFKVKAENPEIVSEKEDQVKEALDKIVHDQITQRLQLMFQQQAGQVNQQQAQQLKQQQNAELQKRLSWSQNYFDANYKEEREMMGQHYLNFIVQYARMDYKFINGWKSFLISGREIYYVGKLHGEPYIREVNPLNFYAKMSPGTQFVEDCESAFEARYLPINEIIDEFYDIISEDEIDDLLTTYGFGTSMSAPGNLVIDSMPNMDNPDRPTLFTSNTSVIELGGRRLIRVINVTWRSFKKIGFLTIIGKDGEPQEIVVDENFKLPSDDKESILEWYWINEVWEGVKIGEEIYLNMRPVPDQDYAMNNISKKPIPYYGIIRQNINGAPYSLLNELMQDQVLYNIVKYKLTNKIAQMKGKKTIMDIAQMPWGEDIDKWMYYFDVLDIQFINSMEEGKGNQRGKYSNFQAFNQIDLSDFNTIKGLIEVLETIIADVERKSGVSRQRLGAIETRELVNNVERSVLQSSLITEDLFNDHQEVKRRVLRAIIKEGQNCVESDKKFQYIGDDATTVFFSIDANKFADQEYGVFVNDSTKTQQILEQVKSLAQAALQSSEQAVQGVMLDLIRILETDSIAEAKVVLKQSLDTINQQTAATAQAQQDQQSQQLQAQQSLQEMIQDREDKRNTENNQTKLEIAEMSALAISKPSGSPVVAEDIDKILEHEKLAEQKRKTNIDAKLESRKLDQKDKELDLQNKQTTDAQKHEKLMQDKEIEGKKQIERVKARSRPKPTKK